MSATVELARKTKETEVRVTLRRAAGNVEVDTGLKFFDHMVATFARERKRPRRRLLG